MLLFMVLIAAVAVAIAVVPVTVILWSDRTAGHHRVARGASRRPITSIGPSSTSDLRAAAA